MSSPRRIALLLLQLVAAQVLVVALFFHGFLLRELVDHILVLEKLFFNHLDFHRIRHFIQILFLLVCGWILQEVFVPQGELQLVGSPLHDVLDLLSVAQLLGEELLQGNPMSGVMVQACVRHNSEVDCALVFFDYRMGVTHALIFVNFLEVYLDQVFRHVELRSQGAQVLPLLGLFLRHLRVYNIVLRPLCLRLINIIIFKSLCPWINVMSLINVVTNQVALLVVRRRNWLRLNLLHLGRSLLIYLNQLSRCLNWALCWVWLLAQFLLQCFLPFYFRHFILLLEMILQIVALHTGLLLLYRRSPLQSKNRVDMTVLRPVHLARLRRHAWQALVLLLVQQDLTLYLMTHMQQLLLLLVIILLDRLH